MRLIWILKHTDSPLEKKLPGAAVSKDERLLVYEETFLIGFHGKVK